MWQQPPAEDFYDLILGTVSLFSFINSTIKSNFSKEKKLTAKECIHQVLTEEQKSISSK